MRRIKPNDGKNRTPREAMVEFYCDEEHGILVPVRELKFLPRVGDTVFLPSASSVDTGDFYEVVEIYHNFEFGQSPSEARLLSINVTVKKVSEVTAN